jgi:hypothetical protein
MIPVLLCTLRKNNDSSLITYKGNPILIPLLLCIKKKNNDSSVDGCSRLPSLQCVPYCHVSSRLRAAGGQHQLRSSDGQRLLPSASCPQHLTHRPSARRLPQLFQGALLLALPLTPSRRVPVPARQLPSLHPSPTTRPKDDHLRPCGDAKGKINR